MGSLLGFSAKSGREGKTEKSTGSVGAVFRPDASIVAVHHFFGDDETEAVARFAAGGFGGELLKASEDFFCIVRRKAGAGVQDFNKNFAIFEPGTKLDGFVKGGVFDCVREEVVENLTEADRVESGKEGIGGKFRSECLVFEIGEVAVIFQGIENERAEICDFETELETALLQTGHIQEGREQMNEAAGFVLKEGDKFLGLGASGGEFFREQFRKTSHATDT